MKDLPERYITKRSLVIDKIHGTPVADPYRWLEDHHCPQVQAWITGQNADFRAYMATQPIGDSLQARIADLWDYAHATVPHHVNGAYYTWHNSGGQNQSVLHRSTAPHEAGEVIFDMSVSSTAFSPCGKYLAYGLSSPDSPWQTLHIFDLHSLKTLPDVLTHSSASNAAAPCWLPDGRGFFYSCFPSPEGNMMVRLHMLGQSQYVDQLIHKDDDHPTWHFHIAGDEDCKWAFMYIYDGAAPQNQLYFRPTANLDAPWLPIADNFDDAWQVVGVVNDVLYLKTQQAAPCGKIMCTKLSDAGMGGLRTVVPSREAMLEHAIIVNNQLLCILQHHGHHRLMVHELYGAVAGEIKMPAIGSVMGSFARQTSKEMFLQVSNTLTPNTVFRYAFDTGEMAVVFQPPVDFDFEDYEILQKFYIGQDGAEIPMIITQRKDLPLDNSHPTLLHSHDDFSPVFSAPNLAWLEKGGVLAAIDGREHEDFIAGAEFLIDEGYTHTSKLGIYGGLRAGVCLTQRPDLFGAVVLKAPVLDMLGTDMYKYSPLHNVKMNTLYPPTLILTATSHGRKFAATLQAADGGTNPICIRSGGSPGHEVQVLADLFGFLLGNLI